MNTARERLTALLSDGTCDHNVITVKESDLRELLGECKGCIYVEQVKEQAEVIRRSWESVDEIRREVRAEREAHNAATARRDQRIQELHDQYGRGSRGAVGACARCGARTPAV